MTADDPETIEVLRTAGFPVDTLTPEQRAVFQALSGQELSLLLDIKARLDEAEPDVQAHAIPVAGGALF